MGRTLGTRNIFTRKQRTSETFLKGFLFLLIGRRFLKSVFEIKRKKERKVKKRKKIPEKQIRSVYKP